jgi:hypothetical protein
LYLKSFAAFDRGVRNVGSGIGAEEMCTWRWTSRTFKFHFNSSFDLIYLVMAYDELL